MNRSLPLIDTTSNLIWIDLEMTGLDTVNDRIIEVATIVTDKYLNELAEGPVLAIAQSQETMDAMDEWNTRQHGESGLTARVLASSVTVEEAEQQTCRIPRPGWARAHRRCAATAFARTGDSSRAKCRRWRAFSTTAIWT